MSRRRHYEDDSRSEDLIDFAEWLEWRDEARAKKAEEKKKKDIVKREARALTFAEGMIIAYLLQLTLPIVIKHLGLN